MDLIAIEVVFLAFLHLLAEAVPLFLLGAAIGAAVEAWLKPEWIERWIGGGHRSVASAALAGAILPGCAMSTMPLAQSLRRRGAAVGTLTAFIMIAPILSPHTVFLTATLVSVPMAIGRVVLSLGVSFALGAILNVIQRRGSLALTRPHPLEPSVQLSCAAAVGGGDALPAGIPSGDCCADDFVRSKALPWRRLLAQFWANIRSLTPYLLGGLLVAAMVSATLPSETIQKYLRGGWTAYLFAAAAAFPVYVCDGGEVPLTRAMLEMGVGVGPAFCFMLASVGTCIPTIAMAVRIIGWVATSMYLVGWLLLAIGGGIAMGAFAG